MGGNLAGMSPVHVREYPPSGLTSPVLCRPGYKNHSHSISQCKGVPGVPALMALFSPSPAIQKVESPLATCRGKYYYPGLYLEGFSWLPGKLYSCSSLFPSETKKHAKIEKRFLHFIGLFAEVLIGTAWARGGSKIGARSAF